MQLNHRKQQQIDSKIKYRQQQKQQKIKTQLTVIDKPNILNNQPYDTFTTRSISRDVQK